MTQASQTTRRRNEDSSLAPAEAGETGQSGSLLADLRGGGGGDGQGDPAAPSKPRRPLPTQHLITLVVFVAGAGALVAMRQYGMGAGMNFDQGEKIDYVETVSQKRTPEQQRILNDLERGVTATTPQAEDIHKNPFKLVAGAPPVEPVAGPDPDADARRAAEARKTHEGEVASALAGVVLNSVMGGSEPLARVNGDIVRVGDTVATFFTVAGIQGRSILLTAEGQIYIVEMSQEPSPRPQPQARPRTGGK
jgi:biotin carboxyl carrier protein